ncbi:MAG: 50S ribosomal protein L4 [Holosporaceae bacterium]|jgi:large subunit ribosomal protein L4|nr:50S ribosomal protein L4 [Holosporaceae bacterium]
MRVPVLKLDGGVAGEITLDDDFFGAEFRTESLSEVVRWQLAQRQAGTHSSKCRSDISRTTRKMYKQKGTGNARHGARTANLFVGGGISFGPVPRSHSFKINKKVRRLAIRGLLSQKQKEGNLIICDGVSLGEAKTKSLLGCLANIGLAESSSALFVFDGEQSGVFKMACANVRGVDIIPAIGLNVYAGLQHEKLVLTKSAVESLQKRLLG